MLLFLFNQNIRKYLLTEAREKNRPEFLQGWQTAVTKVSKYVINMKTQACQGHGIIKEVRVFKSIFRLVRKTREAQNLSVHHLAVVSQ